MIAKRSLVFLFICLTGFWGRAAEVDVRTYGAIGDGKTINTEAIQKAIDACWKAGGGRVRFPAGVWASGTLFLKDNVLLHLEADATLSGSTDIKDYQLVDGFRDGRGSTMGYCFIGAKDAKNTGITGKGTINGNGKRLLEKNGRNKRPFLVRFVRCTNVTVADVRLEGPAAWTLHFFGCSNVSAERVVIRSRGLSNNDGIDIDCCDKVVIKDCDIDSGDDAICLKTTSSQPCSNVEVSGCRISTGQGAFKLGTESAGDFENISIHDCSVEETKGIKLYSVDGANLRNLSIRNITIEKATLPILLRLGSRLKTFREGEIKKPVGSIEGVRIDNIWVKSATQMAVLISGIPGYRIKDVRISNMHVQLPGGGTIEEAKAVLPENEADYPEITMFGKQMPAYGVFLRHAQSVVLEDMSISVTRPDARPAMVGIDLEQVSLSKVHLPVTASNEPYIRLETVKDVTLDLGRLPKQPAVYLAVAGINSKNILVRARHPRINWADGVARDAVRIQRKVNNKPL